MGQSSIGFVVEAYLMGYMHKVCTFRTDSAGYTDGIIHQLVGMVHRCETQRVDDKCFNSLKIGVFLLVHRFHVRNVCQLVKAIGKNGHCPVLHAEREYVDIADA